MLSHSFVSSSTTPLTVAYPLPIGILQARILDSVAMASSRRSSQGWNSGFLSCRWILYCMSQQGSPRILEWVSFPFSSRSSWHRNQTRVSCIAGELFTNWAMREALKLYNFSEYISYWISKTCVYEGAIFLVQDPRCGVSDLEVKSSAPLGK